MLFNLWKREQLLEETPTRCVAVVSKEKTGERFVMETEWLFSWEEEKNVAEQKLFFYKLALLQHENVGKLENIFFYAQERTLLWRDDIFSGEITNEELSLKDKIAIAVQVLCGWEVLESLQTEYSLRKVYVNATDKRIILCPNLFSITDANNAKVIWDFISQVFTALEDMNSVEKKLYDIVQRFITGHQIDVRLWRELYHFAKHGEKSDWWREEETSEAVESRKQRLQGSYAEIIPKTC